MIEISEVPAPTSTSPIFSNLKLTGIASSLAAIGSNVKFATFNPAFSTEAYKDSITSSGKKVARKSAEIFFPLCPFKLNII